MLLHTNGFVLLQDIDFMLLDSNEFMLMMHGTARHHGHKDVSTTRPITPNQWIEQDVWQNSPSFFTQTCKNTLSGTCGCDLLHPCLTQWA